MAEVTSGMIGFVSSTFLIVIFGEIVPQSICSRFGLQAGYMLRGLLWCTVIFTFVISYPIAAILDKVLGEDVGTSYSHNQLKKFF